MQRGGGAVSYSVVLAPRMTVLDALFIVQRTIDSTLAFRCACRVGMCGTCAVRINGRPGLACRTRPSELGRPAMDVAPLAHLPVIRDLVVSMEPFFAQWKRARPRFRPKQPEAAATAAIPPDSEFGLLAAGKRDCITCGVCFAACGVRTTSGEYLGPAAVNRALLRIADPRESGGPERLAVLNEERGGVWRCHTTFDCTEMCPKGIDLTDSIARLKRGLAARGRL